MDIHVEDPRSKNNASRVPVYSSPEWKKMIDLCTFTIKDMMNKDATSGEESQPPARATLKKKGRKLKNNCAKAKATVESDESDTIDDTHSSKLFGEQGVKSSRKPDEGSQYSELNTISKDTSLLMHERVESGQTVR